MEYSFQIADLIVRSLNNSLEGEERRRLDEWLQASPQNRALYERLHNAATVRQDLKGYDRYDMEGIKARVAAQFPSVISPGSGSSTAEETPPVRHLPFMKTGWFRYAAALILCITAVAAFILLKREPLPADHIVQQQPPSNPDIAPGATGAVLTLGDGSEISLDSLGNGIIANEGGTEVALNNGLVVYRAHENGAPTYNTMSTPRGRQFQLLLPDGTKAWLNAASSLKYPTAFSGAERRVEVTGEVYFEVAPNKNMPFRVSVNQVQIEVLGTHFNVNAYPDEELITTTLLEGAVKIETAAGVRTLAPAQQSRVDGQGRQQVLNDVNLDEIIAWKNGYFYFEDTDMSAILRQFARWYDVEVVYEGAVSPRKFFGVITRNSTLANVLKMLQASDLKFRIEGKKLVVQSG